MKLSGSVFRRPSRLRSFVAMSATFLSLLGPLGRTNVSYGFEKPQPAPLAAAASSVGVFPTSLTGGTTAMGEVFLSAPAPSGGATVSLSSNNPFVTVPKNVKVLERDSSATFNVKTKQVSSTTTGIITASYGGQSPTASLSVNPIATTSITIGETNVTPTADNGNANLLLAQPVTLSQTGTVQSLSFYVTTAAGNLRLGVYDASGPGGIPGSKKAETASFATTTGWNTVSVVNPVSLPAGSYYLAYLPSDNNLSFRKAVTGGTSYKYNYTFGALPTTFSTTPSTTLSHWSLYGTLNVQTSGPVMSSMSVNPTTVTGGASSQGTVTLTAPAPSSGAVVSLSSTNPSVATGPTSVTVPAGSLTANFTVSTSSVSTSTSVSLSGSYNSVSRSASLTVNPVAPPPDTTPPVISGVVSSGITANGATIAWSTNEASNTQVDYGTTTSYGSSSTLNTTLVTGHSAALSGLSSGTLYHYRVKSGDAAGNLGTSGDFTFTTSAVDTTPPAISLVTATSITSVGAIISWTTNEASNSQVDYGPTTAYGSSSVLDATLLTGHFTTLISLSASSTYHYRVKSRDAAGNLATSGDFTFTTLSLDLTAPVISAVSSSAISSNGASIAWATNESSNSQVDYGTTTSYGSTTVLDSSMVTAHSQSLASLTPSTVYHYRVKSRDGAGNLATSGDFTFTTSAGSSSTGDFYVSTTGSDSNPGTQNQPFRTIARGISALSAGKVLIIFGGTYAEPITNSIPSGTSWTSATTLRAASGQTVVVQPTATQNPARVANFSSGQAYIILDGLVLDAINCQLEGAKMSGANHIRFVNCEVKNTKTMGILTSAGASSGFNEILNCNIHNIGTSTQLDHAIYLKSPNNIVDGCQIHDTTSHGIHLYDTVTGMNNNIFRDNVIYNCKRGIGIYGGTGNMAYNNIIYDHVEYGILLRNDAGDLGGTMVYNNTIVNSGNNGIYNQSTASPTLIRNNICFDHAQDILDSTGTAVKSNNLTGVDPNFVNLAAKDFHLNLGSPAVNAGMTLSQVPTDINGFARPQGGAYDIGAYER